MLEIIYCEFVGARPADAKASAFAFRRARGVIEGCAGALGLVLTPLTWKRLADIPPGPEHKDVARTRAIAKWPAHADLFRRKADVDCAEAALIALAGLKPSRAMSEPDHLESDVLCGAALALRRRANRQSTIAESGKTIADCGVTIMTGEPVLAARLSAVLSELAEEFEGVA